MRQVTIHQSINRPTLFLGCDRELALITALVCALIAYFNLNIIGVICAIALWLASVYALQQLAKADVFMRKVALRHRIYADHYPAKSGLHSVIRVPRRNWS